MIDERAPGVDDIRKELAQFLETHSPYDLIVDQYSLLYQALARRELSNWTSDAIVLLQWPIWSRTKRSPMTKTEMSALVDQWHAGIRAAALAHDRESFDRAEWKSEDLMRQLFDAPIRQVREFYRLLVERLKADPSIPFWLWSTYEIHATAVKHAAKPEDRPGVRLRDDIAQQIAQAVAPMLLDQLPEALANSLRWRGDESLQRVKKAVDSGEHVPRLKGKESCLFLEVGDEVVMI